MYAIGSFGFHKPVKSSLPGFSRNQFEQLLLFFEQLKVELYFTRAHLCNVNQAHTRYPSSEKSLALSVRGNVLFNR